MSDTRALPPPRPKTLTLENVSDLVALQSRIGDWASQTFGPTPAAVHTARMDREMADVHDCVAIGDLDNLDRALAGVIVVALALADSINLDLTEARRFWPNRRIMRPASGVKPAGASGAEKKQGGAGDGQVLDSALSHRIAVLAARGHLSPQEACQILRDQGASLNAAVAFLVEAGVDHRQFEAGTTAHLSASDIDDLKVQGRLRSRPMSPWNIPDVIYPPDGFQGAELFGPVA